jgi:hypothetical protein
MSPAPAAHSSSAVPASSASRHACARKVLGRPKRRKLAGVFLWECSCEGLKLAHATCGPTRRLTRFALPGRPLRAVVPSSHEVCCENIYGRVRSHCRFGNRGTEYVSESVMKRMSGGTKRQCDRALVYGRAEPARTRGVRTVPSLERFNAVQNGLKQQSPGLNCSKLAAARPGAPPASPAARPDAPGTAPAG